MSSLRVLSEVITTFIEIQNVNYILYDGVVEMFRSFSKFSTS